MAMYLVSVHTLNTDNFVLPQKKKKYSFMNIHTDLMVTGHMPLRGRTTLLEHVIAHLVLCL